MAELPGLLGFHEIVGMPPGSGYQRPGEVPLPDVLLSGDELVHLLALCGSGRGDRSDHAHPESRVNALDPDCPACVSIFEKYEAVVR